MNKKKILLKIPLMKQMKFLKNFQKLMLFNKILNKNLWKLSEKLIKLILPIFKS